MIGGDGTIKTEVVHYIGGTIIKHPGIPLFTRQDYHKAMKDQKEAGVPRGSIGQEVIAPVEESKPPERAGHSQAAAEGSEQPPERAGAQALTPDSLILPVGTVSSSSDSIVCLHCTVRMMPGLTCCRQCGTQQVKDLPVKHAAAVENAAAHFLATTLQWKTTVAKASGARGGLSAGQMLATGRVDQAQSKYCKDQYDRALKLMELDVATGNRSGRNFTGCADRYDHSPRLRESQAVSRKDRAHKGEIGNRMRGWNNVVLASKDWSDILEENCATELAEEAQWTEAQFMDWMALSRAAQNTTRRVDPTTGERVTVSTRVISREWRDENLPRSRLRQHGAGPTVPTAEHPDLGLYSSESRQYGLPGGLTSLVENPQEDVAGDRTHARYKEGGAMDRARARNSSSRLQGLAETIPTYRLPPPPKAPQVSSSSSSSGGQWLAPPMAPPSVAPSFASTASEVLVPPPRARGAGGPMVPGWHPQVPAPKPAVIRRSPYRDVRTSSQGDAQRRQPSRGQDQWQKGGGKGWHTDRGWQGRDRGWNEDPHWDDRTGWQTRRGRGADRQANTGWWERNWPRGPDGITRRGPNA